MMISDFDGDIEVLLDEKVHREIPILATRNLFCFPGVAMPIVIGRRASLNLVNKLKENEGQIFGIFCQKKAEVDSPLESDLFEI